MNVSGIRPISPYEFKKATPAAKKVEPEKKERSFADTLGDAYERGSSSIHSVVNDYHISNEKFGLAYMRYIMDYGNSDNENLQNLKEIIDKELVGD